MPGKVFYAPYELKLVPKKFYDFVNLVHGVARKIYELEHVPDDRRLFDYTSVQPFDMFALDLYKARQDIFSILFNSFTRRDYYVQERVKKIVEVGDRDLEKKYHKVFVFDNVPENSIYEVDVDWVYRLERQRTWPCVVFRSEKKLFPNKVFEIVQQGRFSDLPPPMSIFLPKTLCLTTQHFMSQPANLTPSPTARFLTDSC